jgi:2-isopropylmalate synthase
MEQEFGFNLPKRMRIEFGKIINRLADVKGGEISNQEIYDAFAAEYLERDEPLRLESFRVVPCDEEILGSQCVECIARLHMNGAFQEIRATGNGPIDAFVVALQNAGVPPFEILSYAEHSLGSGAEARAVAYIEIKTQNNSTLFGAATDTNIELASIKAVLSALNRSLTQ